MPRSPSCSASHSPARGNAVSPNHSPRRSPSPQAYEPPQQEPEQEPKLFITCIPDGITEDDLRGIFEQHGNIVNVFVKTNDRGPFAFVKFDTMEEAQAGLECNGQEFREKNMRVQLAKPRAPQTGPKLCRKCQQPGHIAKYCPDGDGNNQERPRRNRGEMVSEDQEPKLNIRNVATSVTDDDLRNHFEKYGNITDVRIIDKGTSRFAFVSFDTLEEATKGLEANGTELCGQSLNVSYARPRKPREGGQGGSRACHKCQKEGHFARQCPGVEEEMVNEAEEKPARRSPSRSASGSPKRSRKRQRSPSCSGSVDRNRGRNEEIVPEVNPDQEPRIRVTNFESGVTRDDLRTLFEPCGNVTDSFCKEGGRGMFGFVAFDTIEEAQKALEFNGSEFRGQELRVEFAKPRPPKGGPKTCHKCQQEGHFARECPNGENNDGRRERKPKQCFKCHKEGHFAKDCPGENAMEVEEQAAEDNSGRRARRSPSHSVSGSPRRVPNDEGERKNSFAEEMVPEAEPEQPPKIYIGGISAEVTEEDLRAKYEPFGNITDCFLRPADKPIAFITFDTLEEAQKALETNGDEICNQSIKVSLAKPKAQKGGQGGGSKTCHKCHQEGHFARECPEAGENDERPKRRRDEMDGSEEQKPRLHISSLSSEVTEDDLRNHFEKFGNITDAVVRESANGKFGFVSFDTMEEAKKGLEANGDEIRDQSIRVSFAKPKKPREGDGQGGGRKCFKCEQEGHMVRQCPNVDASNNRRPPQRYNNHMPRNNRPNGGRLVGNGMIYNPFTGTTDSIFGTENSRGDYVCSDMDLEATQPQHNRNGFNRSNFNGRSSYGNNFSKENQMDVEPQEKPQRKRSVSRSASPQQQPQKIVRKRSVSRSPSPCAKAPEVPKAVQVENEMKKQVKEGFQPSSKIDKSRSRSRSNEKVAPKVKSTPVAVPKKRTPSELSY